jgi:uncharacterized protein (TIGR02271 family)
MATGDVVYILDQDEVEGVTQQDELLDRAKTHVRVRLPDQTDLLVAKTLLSDGDGRRYRLPLRFAELSEAARDEARGAVVIPVIEETLTVDKITLTTGTVKVTKLIEDREVAITEMFAQDDVEVERVRVDREVDGPVAVRYDGDTIIIPLLEEVVVVEKRLRLREEVHIRRRRTSRTIDTPITLRHEDVRVERVDANSDGS